MDDFILKIRGNKKDKYYRSHCPQCNLDKGYVRRSRIGQLCRECSGRAIGKKNIGKPGPNLGKKFSDESKQKMSEARKNKIPWNKGKIGVSSETSQKMSARKTGRKPSNAGVAMSHEQKIKLSCLNRGIEIHEFDDFTASESKKERDRFYELNVHVLCFEKYNYRCDTCNAHGVVLNAHHMNSWAFFIEERFEISNLVCLCDNCHKSFHVLHGNGKREPNTKEQYLEFKKSKQ